MVISNFFQGWRNDFSKEYLQRLHKKAIKEILDYLGSFLKRQKAETIFEVLNAMPGHGKSSAVEILIQQLLKKSEKKGLLIVVKEIDHMRKMKKVLYQYEKEILYVSNENYDEVRTQVEKYQIVVITHERLKRRVLLNQRGKIEMWKKEKRIVLIDEMPDFIDGAVFRVTNNNTWINDCLNVKENYFDENERVMVRRWIVRLLESVITDGKKGDVTKPLLLAIEEDKIKEGIIEFIQMVDSNIYKLKDDNSLRQFRWFKKLCFDNKIGHISPEYNSRMHKEEKRILCSEKVDYKSLGCSILIMDGTAFATPTLYQGYSQVTLTDFTIYSRLTIHHSSINTSSSKRKNSPKLVYPRIHEDVNLLREQGYTPFLIFNKRDLNIFNKLGTILPEEYPYYKTNDSYTGTNVLNVIGKNHLSERTELYLAALPIQPPDHYRLMAKSLYSDEEEVLDLSINEDPTINRWFVDERIENIYKEIVLSNMIQIVYRSNLRRLNISKDVKVHIFIATNRSDIIDTLISKFQNKLNGDVKLIKGQSDRSLSLFTKARYYAKKIATNIKGEKLELPKAVGYLLNDENRSKAKDFLNKHWHSEQNKIVLRKAFQELGLDIKEEENGFKRIYKYDEKIKHKELIFN